MNFFNKNAFFCTWITAVSVSLLMAACGDSNSSTSAAGVDSISSSSSLPIEVSSSSERSYLNPNINYGTMTDDRDGQVYKTVKIGKQVWMAENLNYGDSVQTPSLDGKSWCYNNDLAMCALAGRLYTWAAAIDSVALANDPVNPQSCGNKVSCSRLREDSLAIPLQGVCPSGWHLPNEAEWQALLDRVGGERTAGKILKSSQQWDGEVRGTNDFGFSVIPAGTRDSLLEFHSAGTQAHFISTTSGVYKTVGFQVVDNQFVTILSLFGCDEKSDYMCDEAILHQYYKKNGYSVRCLQN